MVNATAAAATIRTAIAAVSTVTQVAILVTNQSRRALKGARRAGTVGNAGRETTDIGWPSSTQTRGKRTPAVELRALAALALFRGAGQESGHQHDEAGGQPEQLGGDDGDHGSRTVEGVERSLPSFSVASDPYGSCLRPCLAQKIVRGSSTALMATLRCLNPWGGVITPLLPSTVMTPLPGLPPAPRR
jgi:hypothetical protein